MVVEQDRRSAFGHWCEGEGRPYAGGTKLTHAPCLGHSPSKRRQGGPVSERIDRMFPFWVVSEYDRHPHGFFSQDEARFFIMTERRPFIYGDSEILTRDECEWLRYKGLVRDS